MNNALPAIIEVRDLHTRFAASVVHKSLNLDIYRNEIIAIIGDSGTGKTTLLREMILLERPVAGSIRIAGQEIVGLDERRAHWLRRRCGVMFQSGALFGSLTVAENIALVLQQYGHYSARLLREIAAFKIALVGLPAKVANNYPRELSGGMIKRAAVARALALDPEILFLDEPTAGLDPPGADALDELILKLKQLLGLTVIMVTHDPDTLWKTTDRVAALADKKVLAALPLAELVKLPHPWIQAYFNGPRGYRNNSASVN